MKNLFDNFVANENKSNIENLIENENIFWLKLLNWYSEFSILKSFSNKINKSESLIILIIDSMDSKFSLFE